MIDSIVLQLNKSQFHLRPKNKFDETKHQKSRGYIVNSDFCRAYSKSWKKGGTYCPMFTLLGKTQGLSPVDRTLEIQVSLPKLIYGTNLFDIDENDMPIILEKLLFFLNDLGIDTTKEELKKAVVRRIDFSKVIKLPDYLGIANEIIRILAFFNYKPQSDFNLNSYQDRDNGICIKFYNSTQGYAIYDKFGEILSTGFTKQELALKKLYSEGRFTRNAIKFELSLQRKDSLEAVVRKHIKTGKKKDFFFEEILNRNLAKEILLDAFNRVFDDTAMGLISLSQMDENRLLAYLSSSRLTQNKQEVLFYWVRFATKIGINGTWERLKQKYRGGSVVRRKKEIALILTELGPTNGNVPNLISFLRDEHERFEIIKYKGKL